VTRLAAILLALAALVAARLRRQRRRRRGPRRRRPCADRDVERTKVEVLESPGDAADGRAFDSEAIFKRDGPGGRDDLQHLRPGGRRRGRGGLFGGRGDEEGGNPQGGVGSGFVVNERGEIATNATSSTQGEGKAIKKASKVYVKFADDNQVRPRSSASTQRRHRAPAPRGPQGPHAAPDRARPERRRARRRAVVAIGSPFGEEQSLSVGVVSATDRAIDSLTGFQTLGAVQTDAAINQGNSGGPLINAQGEVIGINAQIRTRSGGGEGVGYAIPVDQVRRSLDQIRERGEVRYAYLGVSTTAVYPQLADRFKLGTETGAWVQERRQGRPGRRRRAEAGSGEQRFQARDYAPAATSSPRRRHPDPDRERPLGLSLTPYAPGERSIVESCATASADARGQLGERRPVDRRLAG
jgi:S1-C subfamily serine protease